MDDSHTTFAVCTITASNYLARALVLHDSLKAQHPGADFWLLVTDDSPLAPLAAGAMERRGIHILRVSEINLPPTEIGNFRFAYDVTEVSTAYKPWVMETVARRTGRHVFYIDPDIQFFAPMTSLVEAVEHHELVLTPHVLRPMKRDRAQPTEADIMGSGIYNLGFLGMNRDALRVIEWWRERLKRECFSSPAEQRFTDQRWMDFAPGLFDCHIAKDETFNVAYWNADERPVVFENGQYLIRGRPLSFFHFSGLDENKPHLLTRHHAGRPRVLLSEHPALRALTGGYIAALHAAQQECADADAAYPFDQFPGGGNITLAMRRLFLRELIRAEKENEPPPPSPFAPGGEELFFAWLKEPLLPSGAATPVPRLVLLLRATRPDLVAAFPDPCGNDAIRLVEWFRTQGVADFSLPPRLIPAPIAPPAQTACRSLVAGLEIVGYLRTESGVGQAARLLKRALESSSVPFGTLVDSSPFSRQAAPFQDAGKRALSPEEAYECCVLCVNADVLALTRRRLGRDFFRGRTVAGLWFWEVEKFPANLHAAFREVDEVWVASEFVRNALAPVSPVPVHCIPLPFGVAELTAPLDRRAAGIPDGFFFLFSFDFHSVFRRKNPLGLVEAFKLAFRENEGPSLVIKGINGDAHMEELEQLRCAARDRKDIRILSDYMDASANQALMAACDCYVSLHRSEGLGLTMAEAMMQRKPVIATAYSGNVDFMNEENSYLCRFTMEPVGKGAAPYCPDARWAEPDIRHAAELMRHVHDHPAEAAEKGRRAAEELAERFSPQRCAAVIEKRWQALRAVKVPEARDATLEDPSARGFSVPVNTLRKQLARPLDVSKTVPSLATIIFQGPRRILKKMLNRLVRHRQPIDEALVKVTSDHDRRLAALEQSLMDMRDQNASLQSPKSASGNGAANGSESGHTNGKEEAAG